MPRRDAKIIRQVGLSAAERIHCGNGSKAQESGKPWDWSCGRGDLFA
ncbi:hypothetical protein [Victivallis vadensis]|nr:hypothetical protein [Victivallis vadensis]